MKAITYQRYGSPDVLELREIDKPSPGKGEVLIKVQAASVNPADWHFMRGSPYLIRLMSGLRRPKFPTIGIDVAGTAEAIGQDVTEFKPGDEVFGACHFRGAFAEYACAPASSLVKKPANVSLEDGATVGVAALTALQALRDKGAIQPGHKVLINGAAGGVGTFAVQIAKQLGADVTGVCSTRNVDMVRAIGADHVIDYTKEDFTKSDIRYDVILDCIGNHSPAEFRSALKPDGKYVGVGGPTDPWMIGALVSTLANTLMSKFTRKKWMTLLAVMKKLDLAYVSELMAAGKLKPVIDRRYSLSDVPQAVRHLEEGHARGKVVITVQPSL